MLFAVLLLVTAEPRFSVQKLNVFGEVSSVTPADFDGDGLPDLLVVHRRGTVRNGQRTFALFWNDKGRFAPKADLVFNVPDDACAFDVADIDDNKGSEILFVSHDGVSALPFRDRERRPAVVLTRDPTLFLHADKDALVGSSRVDLQACKLEYSIVSPK